MNARAMLRDAETVCFLGFAHDSTNVDRLHLNEHLSGEAKLFGTTFQLPDAERERVLERLKPLQIDHRALDAAFLKTAPVW